MALPIFSWISFRLFEKQAVVGHLLGQGVLEDVFQLREEALFIDELQALEVEQVGFELLSHAGDGLQDAKGELPADHRGHLHDPLEVLLQPVHAGGDDPLDGVGHLDLGRLACSGHTGSALLSMEPFSSRVWVNSSMNRGLPAARFRISSPQLRGHLALLKDGLHQFGT